MRPPEELGVKIGESCFHLISILDSRIELSTQLNSSISSLCNLRTVLLKSQKTHQLPLSAL